MTQSSQTTVYGALPLLSEEEIRARAIAAVDVFQKATNVSDHQISLRSGDPRTVGKLRNNERISLDRLGELMRYFQANWFMVEEAAHAAS